MPELPEVETVRRGLIPALGGRRITQVIQRRPDLRFPLPDDFARRLTGRTVLHIDRRGKYLLFTLDDGNVWIAHLGMSGRFVIDGDAPADRRPATAGALDGTTAAGDAHDHIVFSTDDGAVIRFRDPRRFGFMDLGAAATLDSHPMLSILGCDPLGDTFTPAWLTARLTRRRAPIKAALLDQAVIAGMGNIYASESLFQARVSPECPADSVVARGAERLITAIRAVFTAAIAAGGSSLRDHRQPSGELGFFQHHFAVYGRAGNACPGCRCDLAETGGVRRIVQSGRATFYCARRQR
ncbi:MAG: bifunctional DNA-formamidopyrimidine glycosylase/DNA-(apurinic or apyrimidinic site) lyase [Rhodospirillales bacterium]